MKPSLRLALEQCAWRLLFVGLPLNYGTTYCWSVFDFFLCLSSEYSCSICSYTRTPTQHTHATHTTRVQTKLQLYSNHEDRVLLEITEMH